MRPAAAPAIPHPVSANQALGLSPAEGAWASLWWLASTTAALLAVDPRGLRGAVIRAPAGAAREAWIGEFLRLMPADVVVKPVPGTIADGRLLGGLDLAATLALGKPVAERGLLADCNGGVALFPMAERLSLSLAARVTAAMDAGEVVVERDGFQLRTPTRFATVLLDESVEEDECASQSIADRLAFHLDLAAFPERLFHRYPDQSADSALMSLPITAEDVAQARLRLPQVVANAASIEALTSTAFVLGVDGMRAPILAINAARALAALNGRTQVSEEDVVLAAKLVIAPRATRLPAPTEPSPEEPPERAEEPSSPHEDVNQADDNNPKGQTDDGSDAEDQEVREDLPLEDVVLAAAAAAIPEKLLLRMMAQYGLERTRVSSSGNSGQLRSSTKRGRAIGTARGEIRSGVRMNVLATLRAAAPWQTLRAEELKADANAPHGRATQRRGKLYIRKDDFRVNRFQQRAETTTIFVVDASGSSALNRLAEAKGAVELLLADCYIRRDRVGVIAFRGTSAEVLLPPTRSLVRAKRGLASLPGGGGTPLALGLDAAREMANSLARRGDTVVVVVLTDGRANVTRAGVGNRDVAEAEGLAAARVLRQRGLQILLVDTAPNPSPRAQALAVAMGAVYLPLPHAGAKTLNNAVQAVTKSGGGRLSIRTGQRVSGG
jgi:magnesium chelatase subunit D